jgi:CBS domain-containing protein/uncharacterized protein (DUF2267 family)
MPLDRYCTHNVVVMNPLATVHEAARAMARRQVGAVLVGEHGRADGIVTDRDLALSVVGSGLDPTRTILHDVMSAAPVTVDVNDTLEDVAQTMRDAACRRLPITASGKIVGIISLDDLIANRAVESDALASIVRAQLESTIRFDVEDGSVAHETSAAGQRARERHERRAENSFLRMLRAVQAGAGLATREQAATALGVVLGAICRRLTPSDAKHLLDQLPYYLRKALETELVGPERAVNAAFIIERLGRALEIDDREAERVLYAIGDVITERVSAGELQSLRAHLPANLREIFPG